MGLLTDKLSECPSRSSVEQECGGTFDTAELCSLNDMGWHSNMSFNTGTPNLSFPRIGLAAPANAAFGNREARRNVWCRVPPRNGRRVKTSIIRT